MPPLNPDIRMLSTRTHTLNSDLKTELLGKNKPLVPSVHQ